jgi:hypothetical protein
MAQRIKGQEVEMIFVIDGEPVDNTTDIRSMEIAAQMEILREGYLGETTDRRDDIYRGVRGRAELHFENPEVITLFRAIIDRARRREPGTRIAMKATLNFPSGERALITIPQVFFGELPIAFGSRSDYGMVSLDFEAEDFRLSAA